MASPHRASPKQLPEDDASYPTESLESQSDRLLDYDFVEEPSQDYFCPISLSVLQDPHQSTCCGHHFSKEVALQLQQAGKPCPMCKEPDLTLVVDKFYKRKINELKVRCPNKGNGCDWVGELGKFEHHVSSCPKRPWECEHCDFKATYEVYGDHVPLCTKYPIPCPNQCEIVTVPRSNLEKHLSECPLQLVECEFSQAGCKEKVPRRDLVSHVRENVQQHLLSMSLLNLTLTRELREKMEEKDGQIAELQEELKRQGKEIEQRVIDHEAHLQLVEKRVQEQGQQLHSLKRVSREVVWVDPNITNTENSGHVRQLKNSDRMFIYATSSVDGALEALKRKKDGVEYRAMTAGRGGEAFVSCLRGAGISCKVLVFCGAVDHHKQWARKFSEIEVTSSTDRMMKFATWTD